MHMTVRLKFNIIIIIYYDIYFSNVLNRNNPRTLYMNAYLHYVSRDGIPYCSLENNTKHSSNIG